MAKTRHGLMNLNFRDVHVRMREAFVGKFFGPIDSGVFSHGLQNTLFKMGCAAIRTVREIEHLSLSLPNIHFLPCNLPVFERNGVLFEDDVFIPSDEPHGIITAQIGRKDVGIANERRARL